MDEKFAHSTLLITTHSIWAGHRRQAAFITTTGISHSQRQCPHALHHNFSSTFQDLSLNRHILPPAHRHSSLYVMMQIVYLSTMLGQVAAGNSSWKMTVVSNFMRLTILLIIITCMLLLKLNLIQVTKLLSLWYINLILIWSISKFFIYKKPSSSAELILFSSNVSNIKEGLDIDRN